MTIRDDSALSEQLTKIHLNDAVVDSLRRNDREHALFMALSDIEMAARKAQERLNEIKDGKDFKPAQEQMGT